MTPYNDDADTSEWFQYFIKARLSLLDFLIARKRRKLNNIDWRIVKLREELVPFKYLEDYKKHLIILEKNETEQKIKKKKKYVRDIEDYRTTTFLDSNVLRKPISMVMWGQLLGPK